MNRKASKTPIADLQAIAYEGQPEKMRMFKPELTYYFEQLPIIAPYNQHPEKQVQRSKELMQDMAADLRTRPWIYEGDPGPKEFSRTITAMESPKKIYQGDPENDKYTLVPGAEVVVAKWGDGFTSPVHGHATGFMYEDILFGKFRINSYRLVNDKARLTKTEIVGPGTFVADYTKPNPFAKYARQTLIHNFTSIGFGASLHYLPEHTRDGRDNTFPVDYFQPSADNGFTRIDSKQDLYSKKGDVILVRSTNVPEYGDHWIVIIGPPTMKEHGLRPQDVAFHAPNMTTFLDDYELRTGLILLKLDDPKEFYDHHGITIDGDKIIMP